MKIIGIILFVISLIFSWQYSRQRNNANTVAIQKSEKYESKQAVVNSVYASGRSYKRSTLLNVSYTYDNQQLRGSLRREGYIEGTFNKGDTITIYVNKDNPSDIK